MGYILPITHYDYKQYQNRMKETDKSPHYVDRTDKIVFHYIDDAYDKNQETMEHLDADMKHDENDLERKYHNFFHITKQQKADITGKGGTFNEQT